MIVANYAMKLVFSRRQTISPTSTQYRRAVCLVNDTSPIDASFTSFTQYNRNIAKKQAVGCIPYHATPFGIPDNTRTWGPRDNMAWWADGSSNQLLVGEKHLPPLVFKKCSPDNYAREYNDCSYLNGGDACRRFRNGQRRYHRGNARRQLIGHGAEPRPVSPTFQLSTSTAGIRHHRSVDADAQCR